MKHFSEFEFGNKYSDAHLSKIELPPQEMERVLHWVKNPKNFLVFCGTPGVGKTYLCAALCKEYLDLKKPIYYLSERQFFNRLRSVIQKDWDYEYEIKKISEYPFVMIDDIGSSQMTEWQKEVLFSLVDWRSKTNFPTVLTSNIFIKDMAEEFSPRFVSRLKQTGNTIIELDWIDKRQQ